MIRRLTKLGLILAAFFFIVAPSLPAEAGLADEILARQRQIEEIQRQINEYQGQLQGAKSKSATLQQEINKLNNQINQINLEIRSLELSISRTGLEIQDTQGKIVTAEAKLNKHKSALAEFVKGTYEANRRSMAEVILASGSISEMFRDLNNIQSSQENLKQVIQEIKSEKVELEGYRTTLEDKKSELEQLRSLEEMEKRNLSSNKSQVDRILKVTKGEEAKYQELVTKGQRDIERIKEQIFYLQKNGVSAEDAVKYAELAAIRSGIRPAYLLAVLEVESGLGKNVGTGNWKKDMVDCYIKLGRPDRAETEKAAFLKITSELGIDPDSVKVSREPSYGCGGAMGPAQFIPSTWLGYRDKVSAVTGHNPPNPWNVEDAFTASAIKLAAGGATSKTRDGEIRASKIYLSGKSSCSSSACNSYANAIQRKAAQIESNL